MLEGIHRRKSEIATLPLGYTELSEILPDGLVISLVSHHGLRSRMLESNFDVMFLHCKVQGRTGIHKSASKLFF